MASFSSVADTANGHQLPGLLAATPLDTQRDEGL